MLQPEQNKFVESTPVEDDPNADFVDYSRENYDLSTWEDACVYEAPAPAQAHSEPAAQAEPVPESLKPEDAYEIVSV